MLSKAKLINKLELCKAHREAADAAYLLMKAENEKLQTYILAYENIITAAEAVLSQTVNSVPMAEYACMCFNTPSGKAICPLHYLEDSLNELQILDNRK